MKGLWYTAEQVAFAMKQAQLGTEVPEVRRKWASVSRRSAVKEKVVIGVAAPNPLARPAILELDCVMRLRESDMTFGSMSASHFVCCLRR